MEYLAVKSRTREGLLKYNKYHPLFGYVSLSHTFDEYPQYFLHLELIKEKQDEESFILAREGFTTDGLYLDHLKNRFSTSNHRKPFDKTLGFRYVSEIRRDYSWDRHNQSWIEKENKSRLDNFYNN